MESLRYKFDASARDDIENRQKFVQFKEFVKEAREKFGDKKFETENQFKAYQDMQRQWNTADSPTQLVGVLFNAHGGELDMYYWYASSSQTVDNKDNALEPIA